MGSGSRYGRADILELELSNGQTVSYSAPRIIPIVDQSGARTLQRPTPDRIDRLGGRAFGDPTQFWRLCDANDALDPLEFGGETGAIIVPEPMAD